MRVIPLITAVLVTGVLYMLVFEREALRAFAQASAPAPAIQAETEPQATAVSVVAVHSVAREIDSAVVLRGQTEALRQVDVRGETQALVISEPLRKGAYVEKGQLLCKLDPGTRLSVVAEAEARLAEARAHVPESAARVEEAKARVAEAEINNTAATRLSEGGFASETRVATSIAALRSAQAALASATAGLESASAGIRAAEAAVAAAEREIDKLEMVAPFEGLLESDAAEIGGLMLPGVLCATVIQLDPIKLVGFVPETEVNRVTVGALAGARLAAGDQVQGRVSFLSRSADPATRTFRVEIEVANSGLAIRDGQTAEIIIASDGATAHLLPQSALTLDDGGTLGVRVVTDEETAGFVPVTLVRDTPQGVWLTGPDETADIIVVGQEFVTDGVPVAATFREALK